ncbi:MAG: aminotransferase class V-fold PLP-dependent enzyme, partial [Planctomycetales bacterium]|nr:aminotransferase class V-fold PLP-dependent enzyme [Planctomycetales bacterium]
MDDSFARHWQLNPEIAFLNHGSFGATPTVVLRRLRELQDQMEYDPIQFLAPERDLEPKLDAVRQRVADLVHAPVSDIAFVRNATDGVNAVVRSFPFEPDDELVVTNHGYNACSNAARYAIERCGGALVMAEVPFPLADPQEIVDAVTRRFSACTRLLLVDHITSPTGILFPIKELVQAAHDRGIRVLVDGAHAPGSIDVRIRELGCDYYTANHHKWLCGPKVSGFLYVRPEHQHKVLPTVISHAANRPRPHRSQFLASFDWTGTYDPCPLLALPTALDFLSQLRPGGWAEHLASNRA